MGTNLNFEDIVKMVKDNSTIIDELNFTDKEIEDNIYRLINFIKCEKIHKESNDICNASHFIFLRNEYGKIYTKHVYCNKQIKKNNISENILFSDYIHNDDYQNILKESVLKYKKTDKRLKFLRYVENNFSSKESFELQAQNCFLYGNTSSGKSFSGFYLLKCCLHFKKNKKIAYINAKLFCNKIADSYANNNYREQLNQYLETLLNVDYLFIDDLGSEKHSQSSLNKLSYLLKERTKSKAKTTILISSKNLNELKKYYAKLSNIDKENVDDVVYRIEEIAKKNEIEVDKVI